MFANPPSSRPRSFDSSLNESIARLEAPGDTFVNLFLFNFDEDDEFDVSDDDGDDDDDDGNTNREVIQLHRGGGGRSQRVEDEEEEYRRRRLLLDRFISLLAKHRGDLEVTVNFKRDRLRADGTDNDTDRGLEKSLAELFQNVLPNHPALQIIEFLDFDRPSKYIRMFVESLSNNVQRPPLTVAFLDCSPDAHIGAAVASMLTRHCPVEKVMVVGCGLGTDGLKRICDSAEGSRHVRDLHISDRSVRAMIGEPSTAASASSSSLLHSPTTVLADTMVRALSAASHLRRLHVNDLEWTDEGLASIARELRTNERLEEFMIRSDDDTGGDPAFSELMKETLTTYNWTLRYPPSFWKFWKLLEVNERVRNVVSALTKTNYRVGSMALWPLAVGMLSAKPTLLYRFLRRGNVDALSRRRMKHRGVAAAALASSTSSSGRGDTAGKKKRRVPYEFQTEDDFAAR